MSRSVRSHRAASDSSPEMELFIVVVIGIGVGLVLRYVMPNRDTHGALLLPRRRAEADDALFVQLSGGKA